MKHWEFLLQKEGDRSWLPLDSPDVEILEGRYRIVARSGIVNADIDIRIVHLATEAVPPKRRVQKRSCRTNQDGLMVVIPFTQLEPGLWELHCSPADLLSDLMTGAQPYSVKLQVLAREAEEEDWDPDWSAAATDADSAGSIPPVAPAAVPAAIIEPQSAAPDRIPTALSHPTSTAGDRAVDLPPEVAEILGASMDRLFQIAAQMSEQLVDEVLQDFDFSAITDNAATATDVVATNALPRSDAASPAQPDAVSPAATIREPGEPTPSTPTLSTIDTGYTLAAGEVFTLSLEHTALVATRSEPLTVSGCVAIGQAPATSPIAVNGSSPAVNASASEIADPWDLDDSALDLTGATARSIQLCLRDPQSLQVLVSDHQPLPQQALPFPFTFAVSLPESLATHLVLGEVLLCGTLPSNPEKMVALTTQAFSVTVDPTALVDELTKLNQVLTAEIEDEERIDLPLELSSRVKEQETPSLNLSFLNLTIATAPEEPSPRFPSLAGQPLPPKIYHPDPAAAHSKTLHLPTFSSTALAGDTHIAVPAGSSSTSPVAQSEHDRATGEVAIAPPEATNAAQDTLTQADMSLSTSPAPTPIPGHDAITAAHPPIDAPTLSGESAAVEPDHSGPGIPHPNQPDAHPLSLDLPSPAHMAFQSLKLQDRFLTRLASFATDTELSAQLRANLAMGSPVPLSMPNVTSTAADAQALAQEIVVDDESPSRDRRRTEPKPTAASSPAPAPDRRPHQPSSADQHSPYVLPADEPVPMPAMEVTAGELTAGKPVTIRVKLPNLLPRIYVKLWITDRQTRSLLDGPRWLVDFIPNGLGDLEVMTPLTVPFGSLEVRFEAIAVEMQTQRESHKVTIDRAVVPPNLPVVSLDDFNAYP